MTIRRIWFLVIPFLFIYSVGAIAEDKSPTLESLRYRGFKTIEKFVTFQVDLVGSAEKLGLKEDELTDLLKLRFKNAFAGMKVEKEPRWSELRDEKTLAKLGAIFIRVWTVGDDYPIAYHIRTSAGNWSDFNVYEDEFLGFNTKQDLPKVTREAISRMVERLAIDFFKARGSM